MAIFIDILLTTYNNSDSLVNNGFGSLFRYLSSVRTGAKLPPGPIVSGPSRMSNCLKGAGESFTYAGRSANARKIC